MARSELAARERDARLALLYQDQSFKIAVRENQRQARESVNHAVRESSETNEVTMMQEFQSVQNRYEGRMEEHERRVAEGIGSKARGALRGQGRHTLREHQVLLQEGEREKQFVQSQIHSEQQSHNICSRRTSHDREVQQDTEELMMTSLKEKLPRKLSAQQRFLFKAKCRRHRQPVVPENGGMDTCQGGGGSKHEEDSRRKLFALLICSSTTTRNKLLATFHADRKN